MWRNLIGALLRGGPLEIPRGGGGITFLRHDFFSSLVYLQDFVLMHFTSVRIFFQDYLHFAVCLREFFSRHFSLHEFFGGNFHPPPSGISNGPPLNFNLTSFSGGTI
jgi:hypothetical protein